MRKILRGALGLFFIAAGTMHFARPEFYLKIMPPWVPFPYPAVLASGFFEIFFGLLVFSPKTRPLAGWGLILLLIAVFPANLHMALHPEILSGVPAAALWMRLPLQAVFIGWVWYVCLRKPL